MPPRRLLLRDAEVMRDVVHGIRILRHTPGFTAMALLVFALGIGAATAIVSVTDVLFMRALAVPDADRVVTVWQAHRDTGTGHEYVAPANAIDWTTRTRSFAAIAIAEPFSIVAGREPGFLTGVRVGEPFFAVLRTPMALGRAFVSTEYQQGAARVVILGHALWRDHFGSDPAIVGRAVRFNDTESYTVVGVMPRDLELRLFDPRETPEPLVWLPKPPIDAAQLANRGRGFVTVIGRLAPGVTIAQAQAEFDTLSAQLAHDFPLTNKTVVAQVLPLRAHLVGSLRDVMPLLLGSAVILLIVACANVANLLLARGVGRAREFAVRQALGASRARLMRQMLVETLLLATAGGAIGLALARWTLDVIARLRPGDVARLDQVPIDLRAAALACGVTLVAALLAGLAPALQLSRPAAAQALKEGRTVSRRSRARATLVVLEVAAAVVLAVGAGLLVRSFVLIQRVDPGFTRDDVSVMQLFASPRNNTPQKRIVFVEQALDRMRALPGVVAAGGVTAMPFGVAKVVARIPFAITGRPSAPDETMQMQTTGVLGDYFRAMGVPLIQGRLFDATDAASSRHVVLLSRSAVQQFWPDTNPIGSRVQFTLAGARFDAEVVGVVGDVRHQTLDRPAPAEMFLPYVQTGYYALSVVVRTAPGSPATLERLKAEIWAVDPKQSIYNSATMTQLVGRTLVSRRFSLLLVSGFALAAVLLAAAGVYGVMSFTTSQRTREFGVRLALGAARRDIVTLVLGEGLRLALIGVVVGVVVSLPMARVLRALLFGITASDPVTFAIVSLVIVAVAAAACYVPARRALRVDAAEALRLE